MRTTLRTLSMLWALGAASAAQLVEPQGHQDLRALRWAAGSARVLTTADLAAGSVAPWAHPTRRVTSIPLPSVRELVDRSAREPLREADYVDVARRVLAANPLSPGDRALGLRDGCGDLVHETTVSTRRGVTVLFRQELASLPDASGTPHALPVFDALVKVAFGRFPSDALATALSIDGASDLVTALELGGERPADAVPRALGLAGSEADEVGRVHQVTVSTAVLPGARSIAWRGTADPAGWLPVERLPDLLTGGSIRLPVSYPVAAPVHGIPRMKTIELPVTIERAQPQVLGVLMTSAGPRVAWRALAAGHWVDDGQHDDRDEYDGVSFTRYAGLGVVEETGVSYARMLHGRQAEAVLYVDATTGEVLRAHDAHVYGGATGLGEFFDPFPEIPFVVNTPHVAPIHHLDGSGFLRGEYTYVDVLDPAIQALGFPVQVPALDFTGYVGAPFPENLHNLEVNVFRGGNALGRIYDAFGIGAVSQITEPVGVPPSPGQQGPFLVDPIFLGTFSRYDFANGFVFLQSNGIFNDAEDRSFLCHELGHQDHHRLAGGVTTISPYPFVGTGGLSWNQAIDEGISDATTALTLTPVIGPWSANNAGLPYWRTVDSDAIDPLNLQGEEHIDGLVIGGAVWELAHHIGRELALVLIKESVTLVDTQTNWPLYVEDLISADAMLFGGLHELAIERAFACRGVSRVTPTTPLFAPAALADDFTPLASPRPYADGHVSTQVVSLPAAQAPDGLLLFFDEYTLIHDADVLDIARGDGTPIPTAGSTGIAGRFVDEDLRGRVVHVPDATARITLTSTPGDEAASQGYRVTRVIARPPTTAGGQPLLSALWVPGFTEPWILILDGVPALNQPPGVALHSITIDWGDGAPVEVLGPTNPYSVHAYHDDHRDDAGLGQKPQPILAPTLFRPTITFTFDDGDVQSFSAGVTVQPFAG